MKTKEVLDKYKKILSGILKCDEKDIKFYSEQSIQHQYPKPSTTEMVEIGELYYYKPEIDKDQTALANWSLGKYEVKLIAGKEEYLISEWKLYEMPHCCAFMISCNVLVREAYRNKRIGTVLNQLRQDIGRILGYSSLICTDIEKNVNQRKLLATNGWRDIHDVVNKRTKNRVYLSVINL